MSTLNSPKLSMHISVDLHSRDEFISFCEKIGHALKAAAANKIWIITLGADEASGKELVALAIDKAFHPERYPNGITKDFSADEFLQSGKSPSTVFNNFRRVVEFFQPRFDARLEKYAEENPQARVLIASNIERTFKGDFNYEANGLCSDRLDMNIHVYKMPGSFERRLEITLKDAGIYQALSLAAGEASPIIRMLRDTLLDNNKNIQPKNRF